MTRREYYSEVKGIAKEALEFNGEARIDFVYESIDSHEYIIHYFQNKEIINYSENSDYAEDQGLVDFADYSTFNDICQAIAYWAFYADVMEEVSRHRH